MRATLFWGCFIALLAQQAIAQSKPEFYGFYALIDGRLTKLEGKPLTAIKSWFGATGIVNDTPNFVAQTGKVQFVAYRRELTVSAPDSFFVSIVAKVARERTYVAGRLIVKPVSGSWNIRDRGYKFLVAPYGENKEMILIRHPNPDFVLPDGRYVIAFGQEYFDFLVNKESNNPEHCVEWVTKPLGVSFEQCSDVSPPVRSTNLNTTGDLKFQKLEDYPSEFLGKKPGSLQRYQNSIPQNFRPVDWIYKLNATSGPVFKVVIEGRTYFGASICKPHDCADNRSSFLISEDGNRAVGGILDPTTHGTVRYYGDPTAWEVTALRNLDEGKAH